MKALIIMTTIAAGVLGTIVHQYPAAGRVFITGELAR